MDWPCQPPRSLHRQEACLALDTRGKAKEGSSEDHVAADDGERNATDGKTWSSPSVTAKDRQKWRDHVAALHATQGNGHE